MADNWHLAVEPRKWQSAALVEWEKNMRGIVRVVTGGGKTTFAEMCLLHFQHTYPNGKAIIVVPTLALLDQWYVSLMDDLNVNSTEISCYSGNSHPEPSKINILVLNTARLFSEKLSRLSDCFLIVDECHRAASLENRRALNGSYKATLGLSATPERDYDQDLENVLIPHLGNIIFDYDYVKAFKDGVIVPFELINIETDFLPNEQKEYDKLSKSIAAKISKFKRAPDESSREMIKRLLQKRASFASTAMMRIPVAIHLVLEEKGKRILVFHERVADAENIYSALLERGCRATIYHSKLSEPLRIDNLRQYKRGVFDILVTCKALDEGLNVPSTSVGIIASSTASTRQRIQRLGRVLRPALGKSNATIYTIYTTEVEQNRLANEAIRLKDVSNIQWMKSNVRYNPALN